MERESVRKQQGHRISWCTVGGWGEGWAPVWVRGCGALAEQRAVVCGHGRGGARGAPVASLKGRLSSLFLTFPPELGVWLWGPLACPPCTRPLQQGSRGGGGGPGPALPSEPRLHRGHHVQSDWHTVLGPCALLLLQRCLSWRIWRRDS